MTSEQDEYEELDDGIDIDSVDDDDPQALTVDDDPPASNEPEEDVDDDQDYSQKVKKRIGKIVQQRNIERDKRLALEKENEELRKAQKQWQQDSDTEALAQLRQQKIDALEIADYQAIVEIDEKLMEHKARARHDDPLPPPEPQAEATPLPEALQAWQQANAWIFDDKNPKTVKANTVYAELLDAGFEPDDPDTFKELDKKLRREVPPPTGSPDRGQVTAPGGIQFTAEDKRLMPEFGLDPDNKEHRKQWAISKKAAQHG